MTCSRGGRGFGDTRMSFTSYNRTSSAAHALDVALSTQLNYCLQARRNFLVKFTTLSTVFWKRTSVGVYDRTRRATPQRNARASVFPATEVARVKRETWKANGEHRRRHELHEIKQASKRKQGKGQHRRSERMKSRHE